MLFHKTFCNGKAGFPQLVAQERHWKNHPDNKIWPQGQNDKWEHVLLGKSFAKVAR